MSVSAISAVVLALGCLWMYLGPVAACEMFGETVVKQGAVTACLLNQQQAATALLLP